MKRNSFRQFKKHLTAGSKLKIFLSATLALSMLHVVPGLAQDDGIMPTARTISVADLLGSVPSQDICTTGTLADNSKTFFLYNLGTGMFLSPSGTWGTHASLSDVGFKLWLESNTSNQYDSFCIATTLQRNDKHNTTYVFYNWGRKTLFMDGDKNTLYNRIPNWKFEAVGDDSQSDQSHIYRIYTEVNSTKYYLTATPNDAYGNYVNSSTTIDTANPALQYWKLISIKEYYTLFAKTPSEISHPTDASFLLKDPTFRVNNSLIKEWTITTPDSTNFLFGDTRCYKKQTEDTYKDFNKYQTTDGAFFYAYSQNGHNGMIHQDVAVHQDGWYIFNCNGFSSANTLDKTNASLYVLQLTGEKGDDIDSTVTATRLNIVSKEQANELMGTNDVLAGKAFARGEFENQVMIHVTGSSEDKPVYLRFGISLQARPKDTPDNEWTAFNDFRMYYAGESNAPDLILDENDTDLTHLSETKDEYQDANMHLKRKFTLNKWNTFILPVSLTYGQMKKAFGDNVKLAKLWKLAATSVKFKTVTCDNDTDIMMNAYEPYIIMPYKDQDVAPSYTATLINADGSGTRTKTLGANHYDIARITLDRNKFKTLIDINGGTWTTQFTGEGTTATDETGKVMTCYGNMGKTFRNKDILSGRDDLAGAYFMYKGSMYKVPSNKKYGLKAFRCWFRLTDKTDQQLNKTGLAKEVTLSLDGVSDNTTGIDDIIMDDPFDAPTSYKTESQAVYNLNGQLIRQGLSTEGLPAGIYIVAGHKVIVK